MVRLKLFILLGFLIILRLYLQINQTENLIFGEKNPNNYLSITTIINLQSREDGSWVFNEGPIWVKISSTEELLIGERIKLLGKPQVRVISSFYKQIWLINPSITRYEFMTKEEQKHFNSNIFSLEKAINWPKRLLEIIRQHSREVFIRVLPQPQAGLLAGIVLGTREKLDWELWHSLKKTGTLHIIAASGMNVMLLAKIAIDSLINIFSRRKSYLLVISIIFIYCLLAGGSPAVVRAGLMASLTFLALLFGREAKLGLVFILTAMCMLAVNPFLIFDTGFQLSFSAMAGMIWLKPILASIGSDLVQRTSHFSFLASSILDTFSAQIATFPILYFTFGTLQPLAFLPNILVIPTVPMLMMLGFIVLLCGLIYLPLAFPLAWLTWLPLTYFVKVVEWWGKVL